MREIRPSGSEGGARFIPCSYPIYSRTVFRCAQAVRAPKKVLFNQRIPSKIRRSKTHGKNSAFEMFH